MRNTQPYPTRRECIKTRPPLGFKHERAHHKYDGKSTHAIWEQGSTQGIIEQCRIEGEFDIAIELNWCMYARLVSTNVMDAKIGYWIGSGKERWADGTYYNSASNLAETIHCRFRSLSVDSKGYIFDGCANVTAHHSCVEGSKIDTGWWFNARTVEAVTTLEKCWLEITQQCKTGICYDGERSTLIIDALRMYRMPEVLLDVSGVKNCNIHFKNNQWKAIPPILAHPSARFSVEKDTNRFDLQDVLNVVVNPYA